MSLSESSSGHHLPHNAAQAHRTGSSKLARARSFIGLLRKMGIPFIAPVLKIAEISVTYDSARKHRQDGLPGGQLAPPVALCLPFRRTIAFSGAMKGIPISPKTAEEAAMPKTGWRYWTLAATQAGTVRTGSAIFRRKQGGQNRIRRLFQPWHNHQPFDLPFLEGG